MSSKSFYIIEVETEWQDNSLSFFIVRWYAGAGYFKIIVRVVRGLVNCVKLTMKTSDMALYYGKNCHNPYNIENSPC